MIRNLLNKIKCNYILNYQIYNVILQILMILLCNYLYNNSLTINSENIMTSFFKTSTVSEIQTEKCKIQAYWYLYTHVRSEDFAKFYEKTPDVLNLFFNEKILEAFMNKINWDTLMLKYRGNTEPNFSILLDELREKYTYYIEDYYQKYKSYGKAWENSMKFCLETTPHYCAKFCLEMTPHYSLKFVQDHKNSLPFLIPLIMVSNFLIISNPLPWMYSITCPILIEPSGSILSQILPKIDVNAVGQVYPLIGPIIPENIKILISNLPIFNDAKNDFSIITEWGLDAYLNSPEFIQSIIKHNLVMSVIGIFIINIIINTW